MMLKLFVFSCVVSGMIQRISGLFKKMQGKKKKIRDVPLDSEMKNNDLKICIIWDLEGKVFPCNL